MRDTRFEDLLPRLVFTCCKGTFVVPCLGLFRRAIKATFVELLRLDESCCPKNRSIVRDMLVVV
jgi:hypothetical protein